MLYVLDKVIDKRSGKEKTDVLSQRMIGRTFDFEYDDIVVSHDNRIFLKSVPNFFKSIVLFGVFGKGLNESECTLSLENRRNRYCFVAWRGRKEVKS